MKKWRTKNILYYSKPKFKKKKKKRKETKNKEIEGIDGRIMKRLKRY